MKVLRIVVITLVAAISMFAQGSGPKQNSSPKLELPELHTIKTVTLSPSYGCRSHKDFQRGYQNTALFLLPSSRPSSPDLLFNGACKSEDFFEAAVAGDDMSLIADLGAGVSIDDVTAIRAFNLERVHSWAAYSKFVRSVKVEPNHTYAVLLNGRYKRGLFIFSVVRYTENEKVELRYAVKAYQIVPGGYIGSPGFDWEKASH